MRFFRYKIPRSKTSPGGYGFTSAETATQADLILEDCRRLGWECVELYPERAAPVFAMAPEIIAAAKAEHVAKYK